MAETTAANGVPAEGEEQKQETIQENVDQGSDDAGGKLERLERENKEMKDRIRSLTIEAEGSEEDKKLFDSIAARAVDLETEVARLQHDLITALTEGEEFNQEILDLKKTVAEKVEKIESVERELEALKKEKAETEKKVRELERKVGVMEMRETEEKSKKMRVEEDMRDKIGEKDREIGVYKKAIDQLESELEKMKAMEEALLRSNNKSKEMESLTGQLQLEFEESQKLISALKEKSLDSVKETDRDIAVVCHHKTFDWQWPAAAAVVSGGLVYAFLYLRRR